MSTILFIPAILIDRFFKKIGVKKLIFLSITSSIVLFVSYKIIIKLIIANLNLPFIVNALSRFIGNPITIYEPPQLPIMLMDFVLIGMLVVKFFIGRSSIEEIRQYFLLMFTFILINAILFTNFSNTNVSHRLVLFVYFFVPFFFLC